MTFLRIRNLLVSLKNFYSTKISTAENVESGISLVKNLTTENQYEMLADNITPLWKVDYCDQLLLKKKWSRGLLNTIKSKHLPKTKTALYNIVPSPQVIEYRNSDDFSIWTGVDGDPKTVGLFVGSGSNGSAICVPPCQLLNMKAVHCEVAKVFQDLIRKSPLKACHLLNDGGYWRGITVRSNHEGEILAVVRAHPLGVPIDNIDDVKVGLVKYFEENSSTTKSLYIQHCPHTKCTHQQAPFIHLSGRAFIFENVDRYILRISPDSYFPINLEIVPLLYDCVLNFANVNKNFTLLELNCGIGAFSIFASSFVRGCVGIDSSPLAVADANFNAKSNNIKNCHFVCGPIEKELKAAFKELDSTMNITVVINAGNVGVSKELLKLLRRCVQLKRLIYISGKADNPMVVRSVIDLCHPKFDLSHPFYLSAIQPFDMNPHTRYCDVVMLFQR